MSDGVCGTRDRTGRHDWRVDPNQVIQNRELEGKGHVAEVRVRCSDCKEWAMKLSQRGRFTNDPKNVATWRPYFDGL